MEFVIPAQAGIQGFQPFAPGPSLSRGRRTNGPGILSHTLRMRNFLHAIKDYLMLRSVRRARLEAHTTSLKPIPDSFAGRDQSIRYSEPRGSGNALPTSNRPYRGDMDPGFRPG